MRSISELRTLLARLKASSSASSSSTEVNSLVRWYSQTSRKAVPASSSSPSHAQVLGYLGAIPFIALSTPVTQKFPVISSVTGIPEHDLGKLQISYGATILSFLGGVHWGLAMTTLTPMKYTAERYIWSVCPCLAAFPTMILPVQQAAGIQAALLGLVYMTDRSWAKRGGLPSWYMKYLRGPLSLLAGSGLLFTAVTTANSAPPGV